MLLIPRLKVRFLHGPFHESPTQRGFVLLALLLEVGRTRFESGSDCGSSANGESVSRVHAGDRGLGPAADIAYTLRSVVVCGAPGIEGWSSAWRRYHRWVPIGSPLVRAVEWRVVEWRPVGVLFDPCVPCHLGPGGLWTPSRGRAGWRRADSRVRWVKFARPPMLVTQGTRALVNIYLAPLTRMFLSG